MKLTYILFNVNILILILNHKKQQQQQQVLEKVKKYMVMWLFILLFV